MDYLVSNRAFVLFAVLLFAINTLLLNDVATLWSGAEAALLDQARRGEAGTLPVDVARLTGAADALAVFSLRMPGLILGLSTLVVLYLLGRRVFGQAGILYAILVMVSGFWVVTLGKLGSGDIWVWAVQLLGQLGVVLYVKKPEPSYRLLVYGMILLSVWIEPLGSSLLFVLFPLALTGLHPQGKRMWLLQPWVAVLVALGVLYFSGLLTWMPATQYTGWGRMHGLRFAGLLVLSLLPFLGFLVAGIWGGIQKVRKGEELSLILLLWLGVGLLVQSPAAIAGAALLTGKHMQDYFRQNYPYDSLVKVVMLLHLISFFFMALLLMLGGFFQFRGVGFRSGMAFSATYWMLSFAAVIGLYGYNRRFVLGGMSLAGLLATALFWLQMYPLWEQQRLPRQIVDRVEQIGTNRPEVGLQGSVADHLPLQLYLAKAGKTIIRDGETTTREPEIVIAPVGEGIDRPVQDTVRGLSDRLRPVQWVIGH